jgi:hypothetical protein
MALTIMFLFAKKIPILIIYTLCLFGGTALSQTNTCQIFSSKNVMMGNGLQAQTIAKQSLSFNVECTNQNIEWLLIGSPSDGFKIGTSPLAGTNHYAMAFVDNSYSKPLAENKWNVRGVGNQTLTLYVGVGQQTAGNPGNNGLNAIADTGSFSTRLPITLNYLDQTQQSSLTVYGFVLTKCQIPSNKSVLMGSTIQAALVAKKSVLIDVQCSAQSTEWKITGNPSSPFKIGTSPLAGTDHYAMAFVDNSYSKPLAENKWNVRGIGNQTVTLYVGVGQQTMENPQNNGLNPIADAGWFSATIPLAIAF